MTTEPKYAVNNITAFSTEPMQFISIAGILIFLGAVIMGIMGYYNEKIQGNISMLVGMGLFVILNYFGQRLIVFRQSEKK